MEKDIDRRIMPPRIRRLASYAMAGVGAAAFFGSLYIEDPRFTIGGTALIIGGILMERHGDEPVYNEVNRGESGESTTDS